MSAAKHTPGPWLVTYGHKTRLVRGIHSATRNVVNFNGLAAPASNESQANARLIAAAPQLLEALIDCRRALELANFAGELAVVDAAIAKATGSAE